MTSKLLGRKNRTVPFRNPCRQMMFVLRFHIGPEALPWLSPSCVEWSFKLTHKSWIDTRKCFRAALCTGCDFLHTTTMIRFDSIFLRENDNRGRSWNLHYLIPRNSVMVSSFEVLIRCTPCSAMAPFWHLAAQASKARLLLPVTRGRPGDKP